MQRKSNTSTNTQCCSCKSEALFINRAKPPLIRRLFQWAGSFCSLFVFLRHISLPPHYSPITHCHFVAFSQNHCFSERTRWPPVESMLKRSHIQINASNAKVFPPRIETLRQNRGLLHTQGEPTVVQST